LVINLRKKTVYFSFYFNSKIVRVFCRTLQFAPEALGVITCGRTWGSERRVVCLEEGFVLRSHPLEMSLLRNGVRSRTIDSWLSDLSSPFSPTHQLEQSRAHNVNVLSGSADDGHRLAVVPHLGVVCFIHRNGLQCPN
jgi:hypothetical protein